MIHKLFKIWRRGSNEIHCIILPNEPRKFMNFQNFLVMLIILWFFVFRVLYFLFSKISRIWHGRYFLLHFSLELNSLAKQAENKLESTLAWLEITNLTRDFLKLFGAQFFGKAGRKQISINFSMTWNHKFDNRFCSSVLRSYPNPGCDVCINEPFHKPWSFEVCCDGMTG